MLISSGGAVYGTPNYLPVDENHILDPISPYGISKMEAEKITLEHLKDTKYKYSIIRPSNIYGAHQKEANVIPKFISLMKKNKTVSIYGDGNSTRDYVFIDDIVEIINIICETKTEGIFNVSSNVEVKIIEIFNKNNCEFELMHSVSTYPCPEDQLNLNLIPVMKKRYNCNVGYSGHESSVSPSIIAVSLGATSLERHITLDRSMYGSDQSASIEKKGMVNLVESIDKMLEAVGEEKVGYIHPEEVPIAKKLRAHIK